MRTKRTSALLLSFGLTCVGVGQWNDFGGNQITTTEWIGADGNSTIPFHLRTIPNLSIDFSTSDLLRMRLNPTQNSTINGFTVPTDGFLGLGRTAVGATAPLRPWTRLHLHDVDAGAGVVTLGFRDWMRNGITFTGHGDHMYVGHRYGPGAQDPTDAIIHWADNSGTQLGPDLMRFVFTSTFSAAAPSGENSLFGREIMQLHPQGFIGMGDWNAASVAAGALVPPTERLDVLNGRLRIRELPDPAGEATGAYKVMVVDDTPAPNGERGVVKWVDPNNLPGGDCDWIVEDVFPGAPPHVTTVWDGSNCSWDQRHGVGIGIQGPRCKLQVHHDNFELLNRTAICARVVVDNNTNQHNGLSSVSRPAGQGILYGHAEGVKGGSARL